MTTDPPWKLKDKLPGASRGAARNYECLSLPELMRLPIPDMADDSIVVMWRLSSMVEEAYALGRAYGYEPKSEIVWNKLTKTGLPWFGMGRTVRASHESAIIFTRGRSSKLIRNKNVRSTFEAPVPLYEAGHPDIGKLLGHSKSGKPIIRKVGDYMHSAKPEHFYTHVIQELARGPYVEMFARCRRPGWTSLGDQVLDIRRGFGADLSGTGTIDIATD